MLLDNFKCHEVQVELPNIDILFLPPNSTSRSQPLDQGIIYNLKMFYKKKLVSQYWSTAVKEINLLTAVRLLRDSWNQVTPQTIRNCFQHALPGVHEVESEDTAVEAEIHPTILREMFPFGYTFQAFIETDQTLVISDEYGNDNVATDICETDETNDEQEEKVDDDEQTKVSNKEALQALKTLMTYCAQREVIVPNVTTALHKCLDTVLNDYVNGKQQSGILPYFEKRK